VHVTTALKRLHREHLENVNAAIEEVEKQIRAIVKSKDGLRSGVEALEQVRGFGFITAVTIAAKLPVDRLRDGKAAAAHVGLAPSERESGTSIRGKPRICKTGDAALRRDLYMPALTAIRHNPALSRFADRLPERGKPPEVIIVAVMRKLIVLAYTLLKRSTIAFTT
jgi:transposase